MTFLFALFIALHGHHGHHHQPPCSVVFHVGCASINPPPHIVPSLPPPRLP